MLQLTINPPEMWDEKKDEFVYGKPHTISLEHSLVSVKKWESKWCKPFLSKEAKTTEETIDYIRCMTITQHVPPEVYGYLTDENIRKVNEYIEAPMTAAWFEDEKKGTVGREQVTAEIIYYWMISLNIPSEYQKWHLNSLLALIRTCNEKNKPPKKMTKKQFASINAARRKKHAKKGR